jgi:hypothetical protein
MENTSHEFSEKKVSILRELLYRIKRQTDGSYSIFFPGYRVLGWCILLRGKMKENSVEQENTISFMCFIWIKLTASDTFNGFIT